MITGICHVAVIVEDVERSLRFYRDVLGFKKMFELEGEVEGYKFKTTYLQISHTQYLELFSGGHAKIEFGLQNIGYNHLSLEVDDLDKEVERMNANGIKILVSPRNGLDHTRLFWIEDPDGNKIEIMQFSEESLQRKLSQM